MADVAELLIEVGTEQVSSATSSLKDLATGAAEAEASTINLSEAAKTLATSWAALKIAEMGEHVAQLAMRYEMLGATLGVMANNVGMTKDKLDEIQASMEAQGITALKARQGLQVMAAAHVDLSKASDLARVAQDAATLAGINSSEAFNNLVRGIATGETRIIRHMGIMVNFKNAVSDYAEANHKAVQSLSTTEIAHARMNAVLEEGAKRAGVYEAAMTTAGKQLLSMQRYVENAQVVLGQMFNSAANALIFEMADALKKATDSMKEWYASGEGTTFASNLRAGIQEVISIIESSAKFIYDHIKAIEMLGAVYASFKIGGFINAMLESAAVLIGTAMAHQRAAIAAAHAGIQMSEAHLATARAASVAYEAEVTLMGTRFKSNAVYAQLAAQRVALAQAIALAETDVAAAQEALALASTKAATAVSVFDAAITGLGGPVGVLIMLLGAATAAWALFKDKTSETTGDVERAANDRIEQLKREAEQQKKYWEARAGGATHEEAQKKMWSADDEPQVRAIGEQINKVREKLEAERATMEAYKGNLDESNASIYSSAEAAAKKFDSELSRLMSKKNELTSWLNASKANSDKIEDDRIAHAPKDEGKEPFVKDNSWAAQQIIENNKAIAVAKDKGLGLDREALKVSEAQANFAKREAEIQEHMVDKKGNVVIDDSMQKRLHESNLARLKEETDAENRIRIEKDKEKQDADDTKDANAVLNRYDALVRRTQDWGRAVDEVKTNWLSLIPASKQNDAAVVAMGKNLDHVLETSREQAAIDKLRTESADLNKRKEIDDAALDHLNKMRAASMGDLKNGPMLRDVYVKAWTDIQLKSDTVMGYMVSGMQSASNSMASAFVKFAETGKFKFKDLMVSIMQGLIQVETSKAFTSLFGNLMGLIAPGGGDMSGAAGSAAMASAFGANGSDGSTWNGQNILQGARAGGGPVSGTSSYLVGEHGPEIFTPGVSGGITPNNALGGAAGINSVVNISMNNNGNGGGNQSSQAPTAIGREIENTVIQILIKHQRPGGLLNPA